MKGRTTGMLAAGMCALVLLGGCTFFRDVPTKQYFILNYIASGIKNRINQEPYPYTIRLREFNIEEAYNRPQIVYRQSPYELQYYYYRMWAVKPTRMITDLVYKHLMSCRLVTNVIRRFDEGRRPDYEIHGNIEALEEYDSEELWFAHVALRITVSRVSDGTAIYTRRFDLRKRVYQHSAENVIREMSSLMEYILTQTVLDLDLVLAKEYGIAPSSADTSGTDAPPRGEDANAVEEMQ